MSTQSIPPQQGFILFSGLMLALAVMALMAMYTLGKTVEVRATLTDAVDAAAYSGALEQARRLNFIAYVNRSHIAHQVAMAHLVSLGASAAYLRTLHGQATRANPPAALIGSLFGKDAGQAYRAEKPAPEAEHNLARAFAQHDAIVHQVLSAVADSAVQGMVEARDGLMLTVLQANFDASGAQLSASARIHLHVQSDAWPNFIKPILAASDEKMRALVETASARYAFLNHSEGLRQNNGPIHETCPAQRQQLRRRGATWLDKEGHWGAFETQSFHALRANRWIGCYYREYPMGWGVLNVKDKARPTNFDYIENPPADFSQQPFWRWAQQVTDWDIFNGVNNPLANSYGMDSLQQWPANGLPAYYDIAPSHQHHPLRFSVQARFDSGKDRVTDSRPIPSVSKGALIAAVFEPPETMVAHAAAETYFARPTPRADGQTEWASLFRPYWQARLVSSTVKVPTARPLRRLP